MQSWAAETDGDTLTPICQTPPIAQWSRFVLHAEVLAQRHKYLGSSSKLAYIGYDASLKCARVYGSGEP